MEATVVVAVITASAGVIVSAGSFYLTKQKEREAEWRRHKLDHYKEYMAALNAIVGPPAPEEANIRHANAANNLFLVGGANVLVALTAFLQNNAVPMGDKRLDRHDELLTKLLRAIREDLGVVPNPPDDFVFTLWSGRAKRQPQTASARS